MSNTNGLRKHYVGTFLPGTDSPWAPAHWRTTFQARARLWRRMRMATPNTVFPRTIFRRQAALCRGSWSQRRVAFTSAANIEAYKPDVVNQPNSPAQLAVRESLAEAAHWAKGVCADPAVKAAYTAKAKELHSTAIAVAVKDWMSEPTVTAIDLSAYNKHVGDVISIMAQDDFAVTGVTVAIEDATHTAVESGAATFDAASGSWKYTATVDASAKSGLTVTANAQDRPGNTGTLSATK